MEKSKILPDFQHLSINQDLLRLYSVKDEGCLWLLPCKVNGLQGAAYPDTGATKCYSSRKYVQEAGLKVEKLDVPMEVSVAGGHRMSVYGKCDIPMEMPTGWKEIVQTYVLDLDAEFDIVLGMNWHRRWKPIVDWDFLTYTICRN